MCEICSDLSIKTPERCETYRNHSFDCFENQMIGFYMTDVVLVSLLLWADFTVCAGVSIVGFEQVNTDWVKTKRRPKYFKYYFNVLLLTMYWFSYRAKSCLKSTVGTDVIVLNQYRLSLLLISNQLKIFSWLGVGRWKWKW